MARTEPKPQDSRYGGPLAAELATYEAKRAELVRKAEGNYVLIKSREVVGIYPTEDKAYEEAVDRFGVGPFMIREIREPDEVLFIPVLGIWHEASPIGHSDCDPLDLHLILGDNTVGDEC